MSDKGDNDNISDESLVIQQYKALIDKLIPLQHENRLLEGLNKFSGRLPSRVRNIIKQEVIRLTSLTDASADNSEFANFPVLKFKHFGIPMHLDKVGKGILEKETRKYLDRYTVGVFESVMNSDHYQAQVKQQQQEKIANAFSTESQTFKDIDFGDDLAIRPNFTVTCQEFEKGKNCPLTSLSSSQMVVETKRAPQIETDEKVLTFVFPQVVGFTSKGAKLTFEIMDSSFNKTLSVFETRFTLVSKPTSKIAIRLKQYIESVVNQFPLQFDLEIERAMQDLERDRIFANSPWQPIFIGGKKDSPEPVFELITAVNSEYNHGFNASRDLPSKTILEKLIKELEEHGESFLIKGVFETKRGLVHVFATHRELAALGLFKQFIEQVIKTKDFKVFQCRLEAVDPTYKSIAFDIHDLTAKEYPELDALHSILFCKDVTEWVGELSVLKPEPFKPFPKSIIDPQDSWPCQTVMESGADRRAEPRYLMQNSAMVKIGLFSKYSGTLHDLSSNGLRLSVSKDDVESIKVDDIIKVSVKDLKLNAQKYQVVGIEQDTGTLRLALPKQTREAESFKLKQLFRSNSDYFRQRDLSIRQSNIHRFLWELSIRNLPCASVLITNNRFAIARLKTVYHKELCYDLSPFEAIANEVPLHGFLADKDVEKPKSQLLESMLTKKLRDAHVVHAIKLKTNQIIYIDDDDFLYGKVRSQLSKFVANKSVQACVTHLSSIRCQEQDTPLTPKRLAQLSKMSLEMYEKLHKMQSGYTHVLYITNVSRFHNVLLDFDIYPKKAESDTPITEA